MKNEEMRREAVTLKFYGYSWSEISSKVGRSEKTLKSWAQKDWWKEIEEELHQEFPDIIVALSRRGLKKKIEHGDGVSIRWALERLAPKQYAPPSRQLEIKGQVDHLHERKLLEHLNTAEIERLADGTLDEVQDAEVVDAFFENARPLLPYEEE